MIVHKEKLNQVNRYLIEGWQFKERYCQDTENRPGELIGYTFNQITQEKECREYHSMQFLVYLYILHTQGERERESAGEEVNVTLRCQR